MDVAIQVCLLGFSGIKATWVCFFEINLEYVGEQLFSLCVFLLEK